LVLRTLYSRRDIGFLVWLVPVGVREDEGDMLRKCNRHHHCQSGSTEDKIRCKLDLASTSSQPRYAGYGAATLRSEGQLICRNSFVGLFLMCKLSLQVVSSQRMPPDSLPILRHPYWHARSYPRSDWPLFDEVPPLHEWRSALPIQYFLKGPCGHLSSNHPSAIVTVGLAELQNPTLSDLEETQATEFQTSNF
jgi:hypothetical protein